MNLETIKKQIQAGESQTLELKKSTAQLKAACETLCAFLNTIGGKIFIGVKDDLTIVGQTVSDKTKREIGNELARITPHSDIQSTYAVLPDGKQIICLSVSARRNDRKPYFYNGRAYIRIESNTLPMPHEQLQQLVLSQAQPYQSWENQIIEDADLRQLNVAAILETMNEGKAAGRIPEEYVTSDPWVALQRFGLLRGGRLTNAAYVLFGIKPEERYPQCLLRLAHFKGRDKSEFLDDKQVSGNIFQLLSAAMDFVRFHLPVSSRIQEGSLKRDSQSKVPLKAIREALVNALCHRDYSFYGGSVSLAIFADRIEIWSYGLFPRGITAENLKTLNTSAPRNRMIAKILYYQNLFESWGRGVQMMMLECQRVGLSEPFYQEDPLGVMLTFLFSPQTEMAIQPSISLLESDIKAVLSKYGALSTKEIAEKLSSVSISDRNLRRALNKMKEQNLLSTSGATTRRKWQLV